MKWVIAEMRPAAYDPIARVAEASEPDLAVAWVELVTSPAGRDALAASDSVGALADAAALLPIHRAHGRAHAAERSVLGAHRLVLADVGAGSSDERGGDKQEVAHGGEARRQRCGEHDEAEHVESVGAVDASAASTAAGSVASAPADGSAAVEQPQEPLRTSRQARQHARRERVRACS